MKLRVYSSSRKIKQYYELSKKHNALLDFAINVSDFLDNVCLNKKNKANNYQTLLFMQEACIKSKRLKDELAIPTDFFAFLKNHEYLFSFFKELTLSKKNILDLKNNDYYANYNEHLEILDEVFKNYLKLLNENNLYDDISLIYEYDINYGYLDLYDEVIYDLQGFLSEFEQEVLEKISKYKKTNICFKTSKFNIDYLKNINFLKDIDLKINKYYEININDKFTIKEENFIKKTNTVKLRSFELRSLQVSYVYHSISEFVKEGLDPNKIAIITPDEEFCNILRLYDKKNMLNYASGISIKESKFYQKLKALYNSANFDNLCINKKDDYFDDENTIFDFHNTLLNIFDLSLQEFKDRFYKKVCVNYFKDLINSLLKDEIHELKQAILKELLFLQDFYDKLNLKELLELFFIQINNIKISYVGGGKVTTMGLLESRGLEFDGVIVVDFNDDFIPKRSVNELFLNNDIRKKAKLINHEKRENLQRFYYESLFKNAKKINICYVENEQNLKSRFLDELDFEFLYENEFSDDAYLNALKLDYKSLKINLNPLKAPVLKHDIFDKPLSFTRLNLFLNQKRTYYYKYIKKLKPPRQLNNDKDLRTLGIFIHEILEDFYKKNKNINEKNFFEFFEKKAVNISKLDYEILKLKFKKFIQKEQERFRYGYKIKHLELNINENNPKKINIKNKNIYLTGKIDRIDTLNDMDFILDYKSSKIDDSSYQLAFYKLLYDENADAKFYDLNTSTLKNTKDKINLNSLKNILQDIVDDKEDIVFENFKKDFYCPYELIYKKDLK